MDKNTGISIVIPCYNKGAYLVDAVHSIINQPYRCNLEIIIVDDASTDPQTAFSLKELEKDIPEVTIYRSQCNQGVQAARNIGLSLSRYPYILPLDADDKFNLDLPFYECGTYFDNALDVLEDDNSIAFVHCISKMFGEFNGCTISSYPLTEELAVRKHHIQTSIVYRKEDIVNTHQYDTAIRKWQDWSFGITLLNARFKNGKRNNIVFFDLPYHLYRTYSSPDRISTSIVSEYDMTYCTISKNPEIFEFYYPNMSTSDIACDLIRNKPSRLDEMLRVANCNIALADQMAHERGAVLSFTTAPSYIP